MAVEQYSLVSGDWINLEAIINDLTQRVVGQALNPTSSPSFAGFTLTGLAASTLVGTDTNKKLTTNVTGFSPTFAGLIISEVTELPDPVVEGKIVRLITDSRLYFGKVV
jgi:hypothetical protein